ncbi:MAG: hypothetical protein C7B45_02495 [Sulfobacillus acidophilus]|uniref:Pyruvate phosphate dikinase AMP/ATP-binding domain-containing protein n=1 Tax=Sulfobacillus acidophilus TaxID=53633 RepID=A0A2T2WN37_9FIRM|nr:MAG: hypothetical protein C7B45_02495 [Sulfobacillus acidophilus]
MYIASLTQTNLTRQQVGAKAASLARMVQCGMHVPPGFVVTTAAHQAFLADANPTMPQAVRRAIEESLAQFPPTVRFAVRSSGVMEDLEHASFAGQYDTVLDVAHSDVLAAVQQCWASADTETAQVYARQRGVALTDQAMGVIVQRLVEAQVAGVSFSRHPVTGAHQVVINASYGLGESVVSGLVTPDLFEVDPITGQVTSVLGFKEHLVRRSPRGGTEQIDTPAELASQFCLQADQVQEIARLTTALETYCGFPVDWEWALADNIVYCLQVRPITSVGKPLHGRI